MYIAHIAVGVLRSLLAVVSGVAKLRRVSCVVNEKVSYEVIFFLLKFMQISMH